MRDVLHLSVEVLVKDKIYFFFLLTMRFHIGALFLKCAVRLLEFIIESLIFLAFSSSGKCGLVHLL